MTEWPFKPLVFTRKSPEEMCRASKDFYEHRSSEEWLKALEPLGTRPKMPKYP